ncbi:hypothetical protein BT96DRAFT_214820 [Gymnopus androsaceus JB14]|uniref:F-box domain-containing protein n=1 Tax=Gymnopus androsaceus JB14 TaxID=1447944 RepID=A0A6A4H789_9AGAR|nr:hypothetical protein BT96DRAFT_214820 [Gymnopus androsaceus JB14]
MTQNIQISENQSASDDSQILYSNVAPLTSSGNSELNYVNHDEEEEQEEASQGMRPRKQARISSEGEALRADGVQPNKNDGSHVESRTEENVEPAVLSRLENISLDMALEIFCFLNPDDLLRLARTSKTLRVTLKNKTSRFVWRTARERVEGLPPYSRRYERTSICSSSLRVVLPFLGLCTKNAVMMYCGLFA